LGIFFLNEEKKMRSLFSLYRGSERLWQKKKLVIVLVDERREEEER